MTQLYGDAYVEQRFNQWIVEHDLVDKCECVETKATYFKLFYSAFTEGVLACTNGSFY